VTGIEQIELDNHRKQITTDVKKLVEKYRAIFDWDIPEIDEAVADKLILSAIHQALDDVGKQLTEIR